MTVPSSRVLNLVGFACCAGMMGFALFAQHVLLLNPCPLCVFQRVAVIGLGTIFLIAALHDPAGWARRVYAAFMAIFALFGLGVAGWHFRLQNLPADEVPSCGPGLDYMLENFALGDALSMIFKGSGECADVVWSFLGLSMPGWVFVSLVVVGGVGLWNNLTNRRG
jgi:disulfide bond formation protein DsbB